MRTKTRRSFIKGSISALGAVMCTPAWASAKSKIVYDSVVVGGGYAGAVAARDMLEGGLNVLVLEGAKQKYTIANSVQKTLWFHPNQNYVASELAKYGLALTGGKRCNFALEVALNQIIEGNGCIQDSFTAGQLTTDQVAELDVYLHSLSNIYGHKVTHKELRCLYNLLNKDVSCLARVVGSYRIRFANDGSLYCSLIADIGSNIEYDAHVSQIVCEGSELSLIAGERVINTRTVMFATPDHVTNEVLVNSSLHGFNDHPSIVLAGTDKASKWRGFIDGALESGKQAAQETISYLS